MESEPIRLTIYLAAASLVVTGMETLWLLRSKPIRCGGIPFPRLAIAGLGFLATWLVLLGVSIRDFHWLPRALLVWPLAAISGGATTLGWVWWIMFAKVTFRIGRRANNEVLSL